jgi:aspartyl aminopeptidase
MDDAPGSALTPAARAAALDLIAFIDASPSPFHACAAAAARLEAAGYTEVREVDVWPSEPGRRYLVRGGSLVAWSSEGRRGPAHPFRIVGAHTDSPNLRIKPHADTGHAGYRQLAVEVYGGALLNSWLDRDLGLSGRVVVRDASAPGGTVARLLRDDRPLLRVPQLAIHLDREIGANGLKLNPQQHLVPVWGLGSPTPGAFRTYVAGVVGAGAHDVLGWDLMAHDRTPSTLAGVEEELVSAPRLDNLCSSWAGLTALLAHEGEGPTPVLVLFDHEEIGSTSDRGAASSLLPTVLERIVTGPGGARDDLFRALAGSVCASADMAHATHPNYADRHEPGHHIALNGGPVLKVNTNLRYATDGATTAAFALACEQAGVPLQRYAHRSDLPCGSTIGPITAAELGIATLDVGAPQLAMHSARELAGSADPAMYAAALGAFLAPAG